ncbi:MAG TPA: GNAT family N-acetyltransferase [Pyrinomonadaceae bacterium]
MNIARLTANDIPQVLKTSIECGLCLWSADAYRSELTRGDAIMLKAETSSGIFVGFAVGRTFDMGAKGRSVELTNIGVRQVFRGQHFGSILLKSFLSSCRDSEASNVILEVREANRVARRFYEHFGFAVRGRRKGFYVDPPEDALTMKLELVPATGVGIRA